MSKDDGYRQINFKDSPGDRWEIRLLPAKKNRVAFAKALALLAPPCTAAYDTYQDYNKSVIQAAKDVKDGFPPEDPNLSVFEISVVLAQQMEKPLFEELVDLLLEGLTKNGHPVDIEDEFRGKFHNYMKLVEYAFKENLALPFVNWLEEKGFSEMSIYLQQATQGRKEPESK